MGFWRTVSDRSSAQSFIGDRFDVTGSAFVGKTNRTSLGFGRADQFSGAKFRAYLFHAQGFQRAIELHFISWRSGRKSRISPGRQQSYFARRTDGLRTAWTISIARFESGIARRRRVA